MLIFKKAQQINHYLNRKKEAGQSVGFVPTMGALHQGHLSLIAEAKSDNDICVTSIFVNPTQFNEKKDLRNYPRTYETDVNKLIDAGNDLLFYPDVEDIYPDGLDTGIAIDFGYLFHTMEAAFRKGHFDGVVQVVKRLLDIIGPNTIYMGQKDYQQYLIIQKMVEKLGLEVEVRMCPTVRESDGLAMSSRNLLLNRRERETAKHLSEALFDVKEHITSRSLDDLRQENIDRLNGYDLIDVEYFETVDAETLEPLNRRNQRGKIAVCVAARVGSIRLIDNVIIS